MITRNATEKTSKIERDLRRKEAFLSNDLVKKLVNEIRRLKKSNDILVRKVNEFERREENNKTESK